MLDDNCNSPPIWNQGNENHCLMNGKSASSVCQYILLLENELKNRGISMNRPKYVHDILKINSICETTNGSSEEKSILHSLSETAIKSIFNR